MESVNITHAGYRLRVYFDVTERHTTQRAQCAQCTRFFDLPTTENDYEIRQVMELTGQEEAESPFTGQVTGEMLADVRMAWMAAHGGLHEAAPVFCDTCPWSSTR